MTECIKHLVVVADEATWREERVMIFNSTPTLYINHCCTSPMPCNLKGEASSSSKYPLKLSMAIGTNYYSSATQHRLWHSYTGIHWKKTGSNDESYSLDIACILRGGGLFCLRTTQRTRVYRLGWPCVLWCARIQVVGLPLHSETSTNYQLVSGYMQQTSNFAALWECKFSKTCSIFGIIMKYFCSNANYTWKSTTWLLLFLINHQLTYFK